MRLAQRDLTDFWSALNIANPDTARESLLRFFPDLVSAYGDTAAVLGADWYDMLRAVPPSSASFKAAIAQPVPLVQAEGSVRWAVGPMFGEAPAPEKALARLLGSTQRMVLQPGRDSVWASAGSDPVRSGVARIPSGPTTCRFCVMLASRGAVYASVDVAGEANTYHDDCDCVPTVIRSRRDYPEGYDLREMEQLYVTSAGIGRDNT